MAGGGANTTTWQDPLKLLTTDRKPLLDPTLSPPPSLSICNMESGNFDTGLFTFLFLLAFLLCLCAITFFVCAPLGDSDVYGTEHRSNNNDVVDFIEKETRRWERYSMIEETLVNRIVQAHGSICDELRSRVLEDIPNDRQQKHQEQEVTDRGETDLESQSIECSICYEAIVVDDIVSWSTSCRHTFHHSCVREWLTKNTQCPICREVILPNASPLDGSSSSDEDGVRRLRELQQNLWLCRPSFRFSGNIPPPIGLDIDETSHCSTLAAKSSLYSYFCESHGIIEVPMEDMTSVNLSRTARRDVQAPISIEDRNNPIPSVSQLRGHHSVRSTTSRPS